jgi:fructose-specific phosphotransferase system IIC component
MKTRFIIAVVAVLIAGFLLGGLVTGVLLGDFLKSHETHYVGVVLSNLFVSILVVWILSKTNNTTWKKGFMVEF